MTKGMLITNDEVQLIDDVEMLFQKPRAKKIIFNPPATVVIWEDGTKTIVKCTENDEYDAEKGLALCYMKKLLGKDYSRTLRNETKKYNKRLNVEISELLGARQDQFEKIAKDVGTALAEATERVIKHWQLAREVRKG